MTAKPPELLLQDLGEALKRRQRARVNTIIADLLAQDAPVGNHWRTFAEVSIHNGEYGLARRAIERFAHHHRTPLARFHRAAVLARTGDLAEARAIMTALPDDVPDLASNAFIKGSIELNLGNAEASRDHLLRGLAANPRSGQSWLALAMTGQRAGGDALSDQLLAADAAMAAAPPTERAQYLFARGKILDERDDPRAAFAAWEAGAALVREERPYDRARDMRSAEAAVAGFDRSRVDAIGGTVAIDTSRVILTTGSPRSGTTLVEQILVSHSAVADGTELARFGLLIEGFGGADYDSFARWLAGGGTAASATADYLHLFGEQLGSTGRAIDKTPDASRYLGLAAALLPQAPLIWLRRNRLDCALSSFRTFFLRGVAWSFSQEAMAQHFRLEDALLERWRAILGDRLLVLDYEDLVSDPHVQIARLLDHCGLSHEPGVFEPHKTVRAVTTASVMQVRAPINTRAIGSADRYREHLGPFIDTYTALGGTLD